LTGDIHDEESRLIFEEAEATLNRRGFVVLSAARMPAGLPAAKRFLLGKACIEAADAVLFTSTHIDSEIVQDEDLHCFLTFVTSIHLSDRVNLMATVKWIEEVTA
jgi:hypothetical protein